MKRADILHSPLGREDQSLESLKVSKLVKVTMSQMKVRTALLSVYDKTGIVELARGLQDLGINLLSTGKSARLLNEQGIRAREIADYTGFPEILGGRVKSLHPKIHAGLLFRRDNQSDRDTVEKMGIEPIDMVVAPPNE